ncbi:hypothetical protein LP7551_01620 [Roseibium album]|nr:hypothetical protein LP7551_01620 [Roseibium album]
MNKMYIEIDGKKFDTQNTSFPSDRVFRDAWAITGANVIDVDMPRAREIHRAKVRTERQSKFAEVDRVALPLTRKAVYAALTAAEKRTLSDVEHAAQKLRDAPSHAAIEAAETPEDLKALTLDVLTS